MKGLEDGWLLYSDPKQLLENIATREVVDYFVTHDFEELLIKERKTAQESLRKNIQDKVNDLGVEILFVGVAGLRPPAVSAMSVIEQSGPAEPGQEEPEWNVMPVAAAFENKVSAGLEIQLMHIASLQEKIRKEAEQTNEVGLVEYEAKAVSELRRLEAKAAADRQKGSQEPFKQAPNVYPLWLYLTTFERAVKEARKFVVAAENHNIEVDLDLHDPIREDMTNIKIPTNQKKKK